MASKRPLTFNETVAAAIKDLEKHGFDSQERVAKWERLIKRAAERSMTPLGQMETMLREAYRALYRRMIERGEVLQLHPGVSRYTLSLLKPELKKELDRRLMGAASLIKLDREEMIQRTVRRFSGWATSLPAGGSDTVKVKVESDKLRKSMSGLSFTERRVMIDQGHKLTANLNDIIAKDGGAVAAIWCSHYKQANYDYRTEHKERAIESLRRPYLIADSWAIRDGYIKKTGATFTNEITQPGEEVYCRCWYKYLYTFARLPEDMLTIKGRDALKAMAVKRAA